MGRGRFVVTGISGVMLTSATIANTTVRGDAVPVNSGYMFAKFTNVHVVNIRMRTTVASAIRTIRKFDTGACVIHFSRMAFFTTPQRDGGSVNSYFGLPDWRQISSANQVNVGERAIFQFR